MYVSSWGTAVLQLRPSRQCRTERCIAWCVLHQKKHRLKMLPQTMHHAEAVWVYICPLSHSQTHSLDHTHTHTHTHTHSLKHPYTHTHTHTHAHTHTHTSTHTHTTAPVRPFCETTPSEDAVPAWHTVNCKLSLPKCPGPITGSRERARRCCFECGRWRGHTRWPPNGQAGACPRHQTCSWRWQSPGLRTGSQKRARGLRKHYTYIYSLSQQALTSSMPPTACAGDSFSSSARSR